MELLYFISGILTVGILYGVRLLRTIKSSHTDLLARYQSQSNISSIRFDDFRNELEDLNYLVMDIQKKMEKDQYKSVSGINKKIEELAQLSNAINVREAQLSKLVDNNFSKVYSEIQQVKKNIKALSQDNFIN